MARVNVIQQVTFIPTNFRLEKVSMAANCCKICISTASEMVIGRKRVARKLWMHLFGLIITLMVRPVTKVRRVGMGRDLNFADASCLSVLVM